MYISIIFIKLHFSEELHFSYFSLKPQKPSKRNNKNKDLRITQHWGAFMQPLL
jgi:hypothetical protein